MSTQRALKAQETARPAAKPHPADLAEPVLEPADDMFAAALDELDDDQHPGVGVGNAAEEERNIRLFREDPALDRRIIEGMLKDRGEFLDAMATEGFTTNAVLRRAAELGLSEALIRQVKGVAADLAGERPGRRPAPSSLGARTCLSCDRVFLSSGPGNRLCMRCRGGDAGLAQL